MCVHARVCVCVWVGYFLSHWLTLVLLPLCFTDGCSDGCSAISDTSSNPTPKSNLSQPTTQVHKLTCRHTCTHTHTYLSFAPTLGHFYQQHKSPSATDECPTRHVDVYYTRANRTPSTFVMILNFYRLGVQLDLSNAGCEFVSQHTLLLIPYTLLLYCLLRLYTLQCLIVTASDGKVSSELLCTVGPRLFNAAGTILRLCYMWFPIKLQRFRVFFNLLYDYEKQPTLFTLYFFCWIKKNLKTESSWWVVKKKGTNTHIYSNKCSMMRGQSDELLSLANCLRT